ncbi:MAG: hypothetical protein ACRDY7_17960 [Acidimicrobiia bacterium]
MRRHCAIVIAAAVVGGMAIASPSAWADHDDFTVFGKITDFDKTDKGDDGPSEDDVVTVKADLYDTDHDDAGEALSKCVVTEFEGDRDHKGGDHHSGGMSAYDHGDDGDHGDFEFSADCWAGFKLDDGKILASGEITGESFEDGEFTFDIEDGNGDYDDAEGTVEIEFLSRHGKHHSQAYEAMDHGDGDHHHAPIFKASFEFDD